MHACIFDLISDHINLDLIPLSQKTPLLMGLLQSVKCFTIIVQFFVFVHLLLQFDHAISYTFTSYQYKHPKEQESERIQSIVNKCYQSWCRHWILECHWFCDAIRGLKNYDRCVNCLNSRGMSCYECFDL